MFRYLPIRSVTGREILDSRGNPTVEVEVAVGEGILGLEGIWGVPRCRPGHRQENLRHWKKEIRKCAIWGRA